VSTVGSSRKRAAAAILGARPWNRIADKCARLYRASTRGSTAHSAGDLRNSLLSEGVEAVASAPDQVRICFSVAISRCLDEFMIHPHCRLVGRPSGGGVRPRWGQDNGRCSVFAKSAEAALHRMVIGPTRPREELLTDETAIRTKPSGYGGGPRSAGVDGSRLSAAVATSTSDSPRDQRPCHHPRVSERLTDHRGAGACASSRTALAQQPETWFARATRPRRN
jgi:hypothetical protein